MNRQFLGVWISKEIYLNPNLNAIEKILLAEIESLDNEKGCFATNDYFAEFLGVSKTKVSTSISKLKKLDLITLKSFNGRRRVLKVVNQPIKNEKAAFKNLKGRVSKSEKQTFKKCKHNNTSINTSINSLKEREATFYEKVLSYYKEGIISRKDAREFFNYWTEVNPKGRKMRFEKEKTWDLKRRIDRWLLNKGKWEKEKSPSKKEKTAFTLEDIQIQDHERRDN